MINGTNEMQIIRILSIMYINYGSTKVSFERFYRLTSKL